MPSSQDSDNMLDSGTVESKIQADSGKYLSTQQLNQSIAYRLLDTYSSVGTCRMVGYMNYQEPTQSTVTYIKNGVQSAVFTNENGYDELCYLSDGLHSYAIDSKNKQYAEVDSNMVINVPEMVMSYFNAMQTYAKYKVGNGYAEVFTTPKELAQQGITDIKVLTGKDNGYDVFTMELGGTSSVKNYVLRFEATVPEEYKNVFDTDYLSNYTFVDLDLQEWQQQKSKSEVKDRKSGVAN